MGRYPGPEQLASATYGMPMRVEITAQMAGWVDDVVQWVHRQHTKYRQAETAG